MSITPTQSKMARAALAWGVRDLARKARKSPVTVVKFESGGSTRDGTVADLRHALERAGIVFIAENGGGAGVRLAKRSRKRKTTVR